MKSFLAFFAVVAFVAVGAFPTSPVLPPEIPIPKKIIHSSSSSSAQTQSASSQDSVTSEEHTDASGRTVRTSTDDHSAEAAAARSSQRADQQTVLYENGDVAKSASSHNDAAASEAKSASKDHRLDIKDRYGNSVSERDKASSASAKKAESSEDKNKYSYKSAGGGYSSGSSEQKSAANSDAKSAEKDYSKTVKNAKGGSTTVTDKGSSASRDANSSSGSKRRNTWIGAHGERTDTDSSRKRADSSHAASASKDKSYVYKNKGKKVIATDKSASAEEEAASQYAHGDHGVSTDASGNTASWGQDGDHRAYSEGESASRDRTLIIDEGNGNVKYNKEKAKSASKKAASSDIHKKYNNVHHTDGSSHSSSAVDEQAASSKGRSASIDKVSKTIKKGGIIEITKEKRDSASKDANSSSGSKRRDNWRGAHGERTDTDSSRKRADSSHAASASKDKSYVYKNKGKKVIATDKSASAEEEAASQYTHGEHGVSTDASGNTASWGQDGDHRAYSEGESASRDRTLIIDEGNGNVKYNKEKAKSASKKAASSDIHKKYNNVHHTDGSSHSSSAVDEQAASSKGRSASIDKVSKTIKKGGIIEITKEKRDSASKDANSSSGSKRRDNWRGAHGERTDTDSSRKRADSSHAASASKDKSYVYKNKGKKVIATDKSASAEEEAASQYAHGDHGVSTDASGNTASWGQDGDHRAYSEGESASRDRTLIIDEGNGNVKYNKEKAKSASKKAASSDIHKKYNNVHHTDGSSHSSSAVDEQAASSKGRSASIDKVSKTIKKGGIIEITKEKRDSASKDANSSSGSKRRDNWRGAHGERTDTDSSRKRADSSHAASASKDKSYVYKNKGKKVIATDKSASAEEEAASQYAHGDHGVSTDASGNTASWGQDGDHRAYSEGESASRDRTLIIDEGNGNVKYNKEKAKSASKKAASSDIHKKYNNVHHTDGSSHSSSAVDEQAASSKGRSASIDKVSKTIKKGGIIEITKEKRDSASKDANSSSGSKRRDNWRGAHGERTDTDSSRKRADSSHAASASKDKSYVYKNKGKKVIATDKSASAEEEAASQYAHGDHGVSTDASGNTASWGQDGDHRAYSEGESASRDRTLIIDEGNGNVKYNKEKAKSASKKAASSDIHKKYNNVHHTDGSSHSSSAVDEQAASSKGRSASIDKVSKTIKKGGIIEITKEKRDSASKDANSSSGSKRRDNWRGAHGERTDTDSSRKRADSSHAASASKDKSYVYKNKGKKVIATDKSASAEEEAASQYAHGDHGVSTDASGNTASWGQDGDHRAYSEGESASRDRTLIIDEGNGNVKYNKEKAKSASKKAASSDIHKKYNNVHHTDGSSHSSSAVDEQAASSKGRSASIDKVSKTIKKGGIIEITKEKRDSASKDANSSSGSKRRDNWRGAHGERTDTDSSRKRADSSHAASASKDKSYVYKNKGKKVIATDKSASAEEEAASQYTHGEHGVSTDASGNTASWGQDGDHRAYSEGESASRDRTLIIDEGNGNVKYNKEKAKSASKKAASSDIHKKYNNVHHTDGSSHSSSAVDEQAASSKGRSASIDKVSKTTKKGGIIEITKEKRDSASLEENSSNSHSQKDIKRYANGGYVSSSASSSNAASNLGASESHDNEYRKNDGHGGKVSVTNKGTSASKENRSSNDYKSTNAYSDSHGDSGKSTSSGSNAAKDEAASEEHDNEYTKEDAWGKVKVINKGESQSKGSGNSGTYQGTNFYHNADGGSGWSSYEGDHETIEKAAAEKHDNEYTKEDAWGIVKVINKGDTRSKETGSEIDYQNKSAYTDGEGNSAVTSASGRSAAASKAASTNYDNTYLSKNKDGTSEYSRNTGSGASESTASAQQQQSASTFKSADGGYSTSNEKSRAAAAHQAASANNDSVSITRNPDGSSVYKKSKTEAASVADASSSEDQKNNTTVDADGNIVTSSSSSSKASYSSASSSSSSSEEVSSEEVIDYCD